MIKGKEYELAVLSAVAAGGTYWWMKKDSVESSKEPIGSDAKPPANPTKEGTAKATEDIKGTAKSANDEVKKAGNEASKYLNPK